MLNGLNLLGGVPNQNPFEPGDEVWISSEVLDGPNRVTSAVVVWADSEGAKRVKVQEEGEEDRLRVFSLRPSLLWVDVGRLEKHGPKLSRKTQEKPR